MPQKMTVLFVQETGHILAVLTRAADPEAEISASSLVGSGFPLSSLRDSAGTLRQVFVPAEDLGVTTVDLIPAALLQPTAYEAAVVEGTDPKQYEGHQLSLSSPAIGPFTPDGITIDVSPEVATADTPVWILLRDSQSGRPFVTTGSVPAGQSGSGPIPHGREDGTYDVLVLVAGHAPLLEHGTSPA